MPGDRTRIVAGAFVLGIGLASSLNAFEIASPTDGELAGAAVVAQRSRLAFTQHVPDLSPQELSQFAFGNRMFGLNWVAAPASVPAFDGLGPLFTRRSCSGCHVRDGRSRPAAGPADSTASMAVALGRVGAHGSLEPDPVYGTQLSGLALPGVAPEGRVIVRWREHDFHYPDGARLRLREPHYEVADLGYGPLSPATRVSPLLAPALIGVGLLELVPDSVLVASEDPDDRDGDGLSGRVRWVKDEAGKRRPGRYGWKAAQASVRAQVTAALVHDLGITTVDRPHDDVTAEQAAASSRPSGGMPELEGASLEALVAYCRMLAVPARAHPGDVRVRRGGRRFVEFGCAGCHAGGLRTGASPVSSLADQVIHPFTDLLLHDMGPGLANGLPDAGVSGGEWRTPALWGLGLHARVSGHRFLLHDGRARTPEEAILWHGGEAGVSRDAFTQAPVESRHDLLQFLESL